MLQKSKLHNLYIAPIIRNEKITIPKSYKEVIDKNDNIHYTCEYTIQSNYFNSIYFDSF